MSTLESHKFIAGQPALLESEITEIKSRSQELDVLVVGMNPSLSQRTYKQLYDRLKKRGEVDGFLNVLSQLRVDGGQGFEKSLGNESYWNLWVAETFSNSDAALKKEVLSRLQYYFVEGKEKPAKEEISWPVVSRVDGLSNSKTITYFDTIRRTLAAGLEAMQSNTVRNDLTWYQIDLFHETETVQASFLSRLKAKNGAWNDTAKKEVEKFWEQVDDLNPKVLLVANSNVSDLIFTNYDDVLKKTFNFGGGSGRHGFGKELFWDEKSFTLLIEAAPSEQMPKVVFSRQLSGGASNSMLYYVAKEIGRMLSSAD